MGKKKRGHPDVEDVLSRPWCYYCERDFEDLKLLISHQKAKHFKCDRCGRRLNTAGGLSVHLNQVHKETLTQVENALPNRQGLDVEIFGMEGIPQDILDQHRNRIIQNFYQAQEDRRIATGNPLPGQSKQPRKKLKVETPEELKARLAEHRARIAAGHTPGTTGSPANGAPASASPGAFNNSPYPPPQAPYGATPDQSFPAGGAPVVPGVPGAPAYPQQGYPQGNYAGFSPSSLPARPTSGLQAMPGLPQRPPQYGGQFWNGTGAPPPGYPGATTVDDLVSGAAQHGDEIDELIRRAESGIKAPKKPEDEAAEEAAGEKKSKKDKNGRMFYADTETSPEERMAQLPRYAYVPPAS
ncbi:BUB3-interacting and GLEBS motif-containing protein [Colletotrichum tanaceti]|uniref:BUB3-interacting and GLEBS motif-containing protein n=1 Tax=Colletotrichum tanaceti TaxID=1306861 RepID=A0A4U6XJK7_9PEZI|nr:BUB3-interacting and GLEBS motif-containing protein [Colletotrichum tanaceti]TKW55733.1 BUB3-interacting and GLEBS motif-containing protein [Colletotrichum tanaceti]